MKFTGRKRAGFDEFAAEHSAGLIKLAFMVSGDRGRAEDAAQEALIRAYQRWPRLDNPLAYSRRVVVNATRDEWRRSQRALRADDAAGRLALMEGVDDLETAVLQRDALMAALAELPHRQRAVIALRYLADLSEAETAAVLEISVGTVKSQTFDALARLRQTLEVTTNTTAKTTE